MRKKSSDSSGYSFAHRLVRAWLSWIHGKVRLLHSEAMPASGPVILVASGPAGLRQALLLATAFERPVSCLVEEGQLGGFLAGLVGRKLEMIPYEPSHEGRVAGLKAARQRLEQGEAVAILCGEATRKPGEPSTAAQMAAALALGATPRLAGKPLTFLPTHILLPIARSPRRRRTCWTPLPCRRSVARRRGKSPRNLRRRWAKTPSVSRRRMWRFSCPTSNNSYVLSSKRIGRGARIGSRNSMGSR
ncbi:MAG: hypothetical protein LAO07_15670 [Acidobacteriia bacterium]|nr:hypothetical protein [Terriglobia bacterium]